MISSDNESVFSTICSLLEDSCSKKDEELEHGKLPSEIGC